MPGVRNDETADDFVARLMEATDGPGQTAPADKATDEVATPEEGDAPAPTETAARQPKQDAEQQPAEQQAPKRGKKAEDAPAGGVAAPKTPQAAQDQTAAFSRVLTERNTLRNEVATLRGQVQAYEQSNALHKELGITQDDAAHAMRFMAHFKTDPVAAAKNMLAQVRAAGYTIDDIGAQVDTAAIKQMVEQAIAPFVQDRSSSLAQTQQEAAIDNEIAETFRDFPDAVIHSDVLARIVEQEPSLSLREAVLRLENWALKNGLDYTKPLSGQVPQRDNSPQQAPQRVNNARTAARTNLPPVVPRKPQQAVGIDNDPGFANIIRDTLREHGLASE